MDDNIAKYIERAIELAGESDQLTEADLAEIASELGLTEADLARVEQSIDDHLERGQGYARHGMWDDAIRELEEANALAPKRVDVALELAEALAKRGEATDYPDDKFRAVSIAKSALEFAPGDDAAFALIARLEGGTVPPPRRAAEKPKAAAARQARPAKSSAGPKFTLALGALSVVLTVGVVNVIVLSQKQPASEVVMVTTPDEPKPKTDTGERDLRVEFSGYEGLAFTTKKSRLAVYPDKSFYTIWGDFEVTGDLEFSRIDVKTQLLNGAEVVKVDSREAWGTHEATLRKGDHGLFTMLFEARADAEKVKLEVSLAEKIPAMGPYGEAKVVEPVWSATAPEHLKLEIRERHARFDGGLGDKGFFKANWEFANIGDVPIRSLSYEVNLYDDKDVKLESKRKIATFTSHPPIGAGEVLLQSSIAMVPSTYARYELVITEIQ